MEVIKVQDCSVISGYRHKEEQNELFKSGFSKLDYPKSKHNKYPSMAMDVVPYPVDWDDIDRFKEFGKTVKEVAKRLGIKIVWGGDWETFKDYPHWELEDVEI